MYARTVMHRVFSALPPLALGGFAVALASTPPRQLQRDILNGHALDQPLVTVVDNILGRRPVDVLVIGSSLANNNVDMDTLADELGVDRRRALRLSVPNSVASHWYALLEHRVYDRGLEVPTVVIVASYQSLLAVDPYSEVSGNVLDELMAPTEPVLDRYVTRRGGPVARLRQNGATLHQRLVDEVLEAPAQVVRLRPTKMALRRVFDAAGLDEDEGFASIALSDAQDGFSLGMDGILAPEASLVPELARLAAAHGTELVVVRPPIRPGSAEVYEDRVPPGSEAQIADILGGHGHRAVDLYDADLRPGSFENIRHMTRDGATEFTRQLVRELH